MKRSNAPVFWLLFGAGGMLCALLGTMLLINTLRTGGELLTDVGVGQSVVNNKRGNEPTFYNTAWTIQIVRGLILFVIGAAASFGWLLAYLQVPTAAVDALTSVADSRSMILALLIVTLLVLGTFMDLAPLIIICTPIFLPVAKAFGVDPVHFGVILILNAGIGLITPPVGSVLFVGTAIGRISVGEALRTIWPFYLAAVLVLLIVAFVPGVSLWLPAVLR